MDDSEDNISTEDIKPIFSPSVSKIKPKKRSLVERELETNLTARVTSPITNNDGSSTSRYGRARRIKTESDCDIDKSAIKMFRSPTDKSPVKSPVYKMHASNSPIKTEPAISVKLEPNLDDQIKNIYNENISLSRFSAEEKNIVSPVKYPKVYVRKDIIQSKEKEETVTLIKNMFSPVKSTNKTNTHLNNILQRSSEKYNLHSVSKSQNGHINMSSVVKALDFDGGKKRKKENKDKQILSKNDLFNLEAKCEYQVGDLTWARMGTYPFWPCIVTRDPFCGTFIKKKLFGKVERDIIHVTFFGDNGRRGWILDSMLRRFLGQLEFEATRERFTPEARKKDPKLYAAFLVSEKKQPQWNLSVEEAEILLREPKRLRIDILNDMLLRSRSLKTTPKHQKSGKVTRTDSDVSLSESLYDTLFSEDDGKVNDDERTRNKSRNKSLDVSDVVTACLDNMAAKTGMTKIQKQSHMDRWLQKAKSKTPEKSQLIPQLTKKVDVVKQEVKASKKKKISPKEVPKQRTYSLRNSNNESRNKFGNNLLPHQNEHDYSQQYQDNVENVFVNNINGSFNDNVEAGSGIGIIAKVESLFNKSKVNCNHNDTLVSKVVDDLLATNPKESKDEVEIEEETVVMMESNVILEEGHSSIINLEVNKALEAKEILIKVNSHLDDSSSKLELNSAIINITAELDEIESSKDKIISEINDDYNILSEKLNSDVLKNKEVNPCIKNISTVCLTNNINGDDHIVNLEINKTSDEKDISNNHIDKLSSRTELNNTVITDTSEHSNDTIIDKCEGDHNIIPENISELQSIQKNEAKPKSHSECNNSLNLDFEDIILDANDMSVDEVLNNKTNDLHCSYNKEQSILEIKCADIYKDINQHSNQATLVADARNDLVVTKDKETNETLNDIVNDKNRDISFAEQTAHTTDINKEILDANNMIVDEVLNNETNVSHCFNNKENFNLDIKGDNIDKDINQYSKQVTKVVDSVSDLVTKDKETNETLNDIVNEEIRDMPFVEQTPHTTDINKESESQINKKKMDTKASDDISFNAPSEISGDINTKECSEVLSDDPKITPEFEVPLQTELPLITAKENNSVEGHDVDCSILKNDEHIDIKDAMEKPSENNCNSFSKPKKADIDDLDVSKMLENTNFVDYLELRQDAIIDENPDLSQNDVVKYLYKTWLYEESSKSGKKKTDNRKSRTILSLNRSSKGKKESDKNAVKDSETMLKYINGSSLVTENKSLVQILTSEKRTDTNNTQPKKQIEKSIQTETSSDSEDEVLVVFNRKLRSNVIRSPSPESDNSVAIEDMNSKETENDVSLNVENVDTDNSDDHTQTSVIKKDVNKESVCSESDHTTPALNSIVNNKSNDLGKIDIEIDTNEVVEPIINGWDTHDSLSKSDSSTNNNKYKSSFVNGTLSNCFNEEGNMDCQVELVAASKFINSDEVSSPTLTKRASKNLVDKGENSIESKLKEDLDVDVRSINSEDSEEISLSAISKRMLGSNFTISKNGNIIHGVIKDEDLENVESSTTKLQINSPNHNDRIKVVKCEIKEEIDAGSLSIYSEYDVPLSKRKYRSKHVKQSNTEDPEFLKYAELRQDALIDEHPELTQDEITAYLYKTWLYEESVKSDSKKIDEKEQLNIVKGLNHETIPQPKKVKKKVKVEKEINTEEFNSNDKPRRKVNKQSYNEEYSDIEEEIQYFEIFNMKHKIRKSQDESQNTHLEDNSEIVNVDLTEANYADNLDEHDIVEKYFDDLTKPKPNIFKGLIREKVCEICEMIGNLVKCRGCHSMFHVDCCKKALEVVEVPVPSRGRKKKKKPRGRRPKSSVESNGADSEGPSDKSQDPNVSDEHNISIEDIKEPESVTIVDAESFEAQLAVKMKEILDNTENIAYDSYSSDELNWSDTDPGKCEIIDVKLKLKSRDSDIDNSNFKCNTCQKHDIPVCFVCKSHVKNDTTQRQKCQVAHCHKYYHLECLDHWPQTQFNSGEPSKNNKKISEFFEALSCPRHVCHTCVSDDPRGCKTRFSGDKLARCVRCPATYHSFTKCLPAGTQILTGSHIICPRHYEHRPGKVPCHVNTGWCFICALGGSLICCEYCPTSFHAECLNIKPPEGGYMCEDCETGRLPLYGEMVWVKLGHYRWWPGMILHPSEIPENIMAVKHSPGEFVVRFFGQYDHFWVNRGRVFPFQEGDSGRISSQKSKIDADFTTAIEHAQRACEVLKNAQPNEEESLDIASSLLPPHYVKLKVNKPCGSLVGKRIDIEESSLTQCECNPDEEDPCGLYSHCLNRMLLTECGPTCRAGDRCSNRAFEKRQYPKLVPYRTSARGWGLKTLEDIKQGQFVIEYVGELIDEEEFKRRMRRKHEMRDENFYFLTLDKERMIDAGPKGNLARFMNHCCEPNCETQKWTVLGDVRVGLFALYDIPANSEVTFNYNLECAGIDKKRCMCGAKRCSGYIGAKPKQIPENTPSKKNKPLKRTYKKRKNVESPCLRRKYTNRRPPKPRELTEIEKDLLIIKTATNSISSDSECSGRLSTESDKRALKRKRVNFSTEEVTIFSEPKRLKIEEGNEGN